MTKLEQLYNAMKPYISNELENIRPSIHHDFCPAGCYVCPVANSNIRDCENCWNAPAVEEVTIMAKKKKGKGGCGGGGC